MIVENRRDASLYCSLRYAELVCGFEIGGEACRFDVKDGDNKACFNFIKRDLSTITTHIDKGQYFDIITPFDYGGMCYSSATILPIFFEKFSDWCTENNIVSEFIRFDPCRNFEMGIICKYIDIVKVNNLIYIDLNGDFWAEYSKGRKSDIARAMKMRYSVESASIDEFHSLYIETMHRNKAHDYFYFDRNVLNELVAEGLGRLFCVYIDGRIVSSIMILDDNLHSYYFLGASSWDLLSLDANTLLLHEVALMLKKEGRHIFFLGGGREGVYNFKQRFSKKTLPYYIGRKIHNQEIYDDLVKITARADNSFFPQYRDKVI